MGAPDLRDTLLSIASTCDAARHRRQLGAPASSGQSGTPETLTRVKGLAPRTGERAAAPVAAAPVDQPFGPPTFANWHHQMCEAASRANCGICWAAPPDPCVISTTRNAHPDGYHAGRFTRAHRRGVISADEVAALTDGLLPASIIWDTGVTPC